MTTREEVIELYNKAFDKAEETRLNDIRKKFFENYGPAVLKSIDGKALAVRLFASVKMSASQGVMRGLFVWLEHGGQGAKKGKFGLPRDSTSQYGILLNDKGKYMLYRQGAKKVEITEVDAIAAATAIRNFICEAYSIIENATLDTENDYRHADIQLQNLCRKQQNPYWTADGDIKPSLIKYFHVAFPDKVSEYYSDNYLKKVADALGLESFDNSASKFVRNGQIMRYIKSIDKHGDSVRFARAIRPLIENDKHTQKGGRADEPAATRETEKENGKMKNAALNTILYGPPGTGKTYETVIMSVKIIEGDGFIDNGYSNIKQRFDKYVEAGRIAFTTFHQSYSYEDFIEGIRPVLNDTVSGDIKYKIEPGVFKEFCDKAVVGNNDFSSRATVWKMSLDGAGHKKSAIHKECLDKGHIRIGGSGDGDMILKRFTDDMKIGDIVLSCYSDKKIDAIGVVTGDWECIDGYDRLKYQRSVRWVGRWTGEEKYDIYAINDDTALSQQTVYQLSNITVENVISILNDENNKPTVKEETKYNYDTPYVFIIDEINRGNVSKIFGELITLIEPTKRLGATEPMRCKLPYSKQRFGVPKNIYIIGTMNTADRSLVQLDAALRRRFEFKEMLPNYDVIKSEVGSVGKINVAEMLTAINERISVLLDREHQIGHAYFLKLKNDRTAEKLASIFENDIIPLLQEYFFDDYEGIQSVLNGSFVHSDVDDLKYAARLRNGDIKSFKIAVTDNEKDYIAIYDGQKGDASENPANE